MIPGSQQLFHSSREQRGQLKQVTQYVCTSQTRAHSGGFCFSSWPGPRHTLCDRCLPKKQKNQRLQNSRYCKWKIIFLSQCEEQCNPRSLGESLFSQTIVPPFHKSLLFTLKSSVRHHHTDTGVVTAGGASWLNPPRSRCQSKKLRAATCRTWILRHQ